MSLPFEAVADQKRAGDRLFTTGIVGAAAFFVALLPILTTNGLYFVDVPNHLFRASLVSAMLHEGAASSHFHIGHGLFPNMAMDVVMGPLTAIMPPAAALTVFLCGMVVAYFASILYWRASLGEKTDAPIYLLIALVLYSEPLHWGLVNYVFGLSLMHLCLALMTRQESRPSRFFPVTQAALLGLLCLSSIFPVMIYIAFSAGAALEALRAAAPSTRGAVIGRLIRRHGLSALTVVGLVSVMDPGQSGETLWDFWTKFLGVFSVARTTNVVPEYAVSALVLLALGALAWQRGLVADRYARAGILACCVLYLMLPRELMSVGQADRRLAPAIAGLVLVFVRGPRPGSARSSAALAWGLCLLIAVKAAILAHVWSPLADLRASYRTVAAQIPAGASVFYVPVVEEHRPGGLARAKAYLGRVLHLEPIPPGEAHDYVYYSHLHLAELIGKDIYSPHVFTNFELKLNAGEHPLPFLATASDLADLKAKLRAALPEPGTYLISHLDPETVLPPGVAVRRLVVSGPVGLYRIER